MNSNRWSCSTSWYLSRSWLYFWEGKTTPHSTKKTAPDHYTIRMFYCFHCVMAVESVRLTGPSHLSPGSPNEVKGRFVNVHDHGPVSNTPGLVFFFAKLEPFLLIFAERRGFIAATLLGMFRCFCSAWRWSARRSWLAPAACLQVSSRGSRIF
jgi:hypothetical protein